jgi:hypothetical protein
VNALRTELCAVLNIGVERGQQGGGYLTALVGAPQLKKIAAVLNSDIQSLLNLAQMTV